MNSNDDYISPEKKEAIPEDHSIQDDDGIPVLTEILSILHRLGPAQRQKRQLEPGIRIHRRECPACAKTPVRKGTHRGTARGIRRVLRQTGIARKTAAQRRAD